jgi:lipid A ethanolaminephosphotransferase
MKPLSAIYKTLRLPLPTLAYIFLFAAFNAVLYNLPFHRFAFTALAPFSLPGAQTILTMFVAMIFVMAIVLLLLALISQRLLKPASWFIAIGNAFALHFVQTYQVVLDKAMMGNVFNTNYTEATSYLSWTFMLHMLLFGVLPAWLISRVVLKYATRVRIIITLLISLILCTGWVYANAQTWLWIDKNARQLGGLVMPWSYIVNAVRYQDERLMQQRELALLPSAHFIAQRKTVVVLVIGESARAADFSLYGYARPTNPLLAQQGAIAIPHARSCATYTTASLQCMLAHQDTSNSLFFNYEALPSYLQRHGVDTTWLSNNWGEPPLKVNTYLRASDLRRDCKGDGCEHDEVLLTNLAQRIANSSSDRIFIVLHQSGSHGPDYYHHYPPAQEQFTPVCRSVQLQDCSSESVVNAYDNTILYTDHLLSEVINLLRKIPDAASMMMYISDHGESLGEHGLYLHGTPYALAPDVQKDIPYIIWMSDSFKQHKTLAAQAALGAAHHAHETVFHSIMGAFDMRSEIYNPQLDIFSATANK